MGSEPSSHKYPGFRQVVLGTPGKLLGSNSENPLPFRDEECQGYSFALDPTKTVLSVTLPNNSDIKILAMNLS